MSIQTGALLGDYQVLSMIGTGSYGEVYAGEHVITRRHDAIKVLRDGRLHIAEEEDRFRREIQVQASLLHPNIATVYHAFSTPHGLALAMELARGEPLSAILARGRLPQFRGLEIIRQMLAGLAYAHAAGVVHRDIKPQNIMVAADGSVKLTDFGLARSVTSPRLTQTGVFAGSPCYMAPEQAHGIDAADARSDTYSAGVVLYEVVTGRLPFTGESSFEVLMAHQSVPPQPPIELDGRIGTELNAVILRALEKDPEQRFQDGGAFLSALHAVGVPGVAYPELVAARGFRYKRLAWAAGIALVLATGTWSSVALHRQPAVTKAPPPTLPEPTAIIQPAPTPPIETPIAAADQPTVETKARVRAPARKVQAPVSTRPRITGSLPPEPAMPPKHAHQAVVEEPRPPGQVMPQVTPRPVAPEPPSTVAEEKAPPKRRNVVVRTLQKVFRPRKPEDPQ